MSFKVLMEVIVLAIFNIVAVTLEHEKSFLLRDSSGKVLGIAAYENSLLITSANDIAQKNIDTGAIERTFRAHSSQIFSFTLTNDSRMITSGFDDMIVVWNLQTAAILRRIRLSSSRTLINSITYQDNRLYTGGNDYKVRQIDLTTGRVLRTVDIGAEVFFVTANDFSLFVGSRASGSGLTQHRLSDLSLQRIYSEHTNSAFALYLSGNLLFSAGYGFDVHSWDINTGVKLQTFSGFQGEVYSLVAVDDVLYAGGSNTGIFKWNVTTGSLLEAFSSGHAGSVQNFHYHNGYLYSGSSSNSVIKRSLTTTSPIVEFKTNLKLPWTMILWKEFAVTGSEDLRIRLIDTSSNSNTPFAIFDGHTGTVNCLHVTDGVLYSGSSDTTIRQWSLSERINTKIFYGHTRGVQAINSMNGFLYSGGNDRNIRQWNISTGFQTNQFARHTATVNSIQLNEEMLFSGASDSRVVIWNRKTGDIRNTISMPTFVNALLVVQEYVVICTSSGIHSFNYLAGTFDASIEEGIGCNCLASTGLRVFSGHSDFSIKSRDFYSLEVLETFVGHQDNIHSVQLDATGILYSSALDGTIKRWNMLTRRVAYSFEDRNGSITAMNAIENILFIGTAGGEVQSFYLNNATRFESLQQHQNSITTMLTFEDDIVTSSSDGTVKRFAKDRMNEATVLFNTSSKSIIGLTYLSRSFFVIIDAVQIVKFDPSLNNNDVRTIKVAEPLTCVTAAENLVVGGSRFGVIFGWSLEALDFMFDLNTHTSQVNSLLIDGPTLFSASDDKTILKWSLQDMVVERVLKRYSSSSLGHLGPVKSLSMCRGVLFSAGSDLTVRRWNTQTGNHEDVYFGHTKSVNVVLCHNVTVFSGGEDFAVYSYLPELPEEISTKSSLTTRASKKSRAKRVTVVKWPLKNASDFFFNSSVFLGLAIAAALVLTLVSVFGLHKIFSQRGKSAKPTTDTGTYSSTIITDLKTIVNSVIGISKHAAYLLQQSAIAQERKIASGGGGELYIARVMDPVLRKKTGDAVIQKIVFVKSKLHEEAFYQEVGIMIMLSSFPHFCEIIGYTDSPLSLILKYYPDGSLFDWLRNNKPAHDYMVKILIEIAKALKVMHSHYLAHCDLKTQNVLIKVQGKVPVCYLTDFGITQVLSEEIVASRMFNIVNLRGLSVYYAAPEAFNNFRSRVVSSANFKKYDIYSFACIVYEVIECKLPWK